MDFSTASTQQASSGELIPKGTLAWAIVTVRPFNMDQGLIETPSKSTEGNAYLDLELTILDGPHARRKVWDRPGVKGKETYVSAGFAAIRHILEVGKQASPDNKAGYQIDSFMDLDGLTCAIEIGLDPAKDGYEAKNRITRYLSPNPESDTHKTFERLTKGDTAPKATAAPTAAAAPKTPAWGPGASAAAHPPASSAQPAAAATAHTQQTASPGKPAPGAKPAWLPARPSATAGPQAN